MAGCIRPCCCVRLRVCWCLYVSVCVCGRAGGMCVCTCVQSHTCVSQGGNSIVCVRGVVVLVVLALSSTCIQAAAALFKALQQAACCGQGSLRRLPDSGVALCTCPLMASQFEQWSGHRGLLCRAAPSPIFEGGRRPVAVADSRCWFPA